MIDIKINKPTDLIKPSEMISNKWPEGQIFQMARPIEAKVRIELT
jgi:hypothetical protein